MAVMLREQGIASRVVTGFRGGEFNESDGKLHHPRPRRSRLGGSLYSRQRLGHLRPHSGMSGEIPGRWSKLQLYLDAANEFWRDWVVNYDYAHQRILTASTITQQPPGQRESLGGVYRRLPAPDRMGDAP